MNKLLTFVLLLSFFGGNITFGQSKKQPASSGNWDKANKPMLQGVNLAGAEFGEKFPGEYGKEYIYAGENELNYYQSKGVKLLRIPFKWERVQHNLYGSLDDAEIGRLKKLLAFAKQRQMWVVLDFHNYGRRKVDGVEYILGDPKLPKQALVDVWAKLASAFKDTENVWGYALMNEPHDMLPNVTWFSLAQASIYGIREVDRRTTIIVGGDSYSSAERWTKESDSLKHIYDPADNLVFEAHIYFDRDNSGTYKKSYEGEETTIYRGIERIQPFMAWLKANGRKGFVGEYGIPDNDPKWLEPLDKFLAYIQKEGLGGAYWAGGPWWGTDALAIEPVNGKDRPQMKVMQKYFSLNPNK